MQYIKRYILNSLGTSDRYHFTGALLRDSDWLKKLITINSVIYFWPSRQFFDAIYF